jgi:hypothetical protein
VHGDGRGDLTVVQHLDQSILLPAQAQLGNLVERELALVSGGVQLSQPVQPDNGVLDAEDVRKAPRIRLEPEREP